MPWAIPRLPTTFPHSVPSSGGQPIQHARSHGPRPGSEGSAVQISNKNLLSAIRSIAYLQDDRDKAYRPVDFRVLDTQAGSVYESLLGFILVRYQRSQLRASFLFRCRPTTVVTTSGLSRSVPLDSALEPVLKKKLEGKSSEEQEKALLSMKVCDPAVGSGHFLIAAHRLAYRLSRILRVTRSHRRGLPEALRKVTASCLYGVDLNPMAVELCQFTLWLESWSPANPSPSSIIAFNAETVYSEYAKTLGRRYPDGAFKLWRETNDRSVPSLQPTIAVCVRSGEKQARFDFGESDSQVNLSDESSLPRRTIRYPPFRKRKRFTINS